jgi:MFS family permease
MDGSVRRRLAGMMALVYAVQGAWWPLLAVHLRDLGLSARARGWVFATQALAAVLTPLWAGLVADRLMAGERLLAVIYTIGTAVLLALSVGLTTHAVPLVLMFLVYWLVTAPAYGLSNAVALRNLPRPVEQFGGVRLWGTAGWMIVGWLVSLVLASSGSTRTGQGAYEAFWVGTALSAILAAYSLTLPHTPPLARPGADWRAAASLLRRPAIQTRDRPRASR